MSKILEYIRLMKFYILINLKNKLLYGFQAPRYKERIWVNPNEVERRIRKNERIKHFGSKKVLSGKVIAGDWDYDTVFIKEKSLYKACKKHWIEGVPWEKTGRYEAMLKNIYKRGDVDGCKTIEDVIHRYKQLDNIFESVRKIGRLLTREELEGKNRWFAKGRGEIEVFIDREGKPIHGEGGNHRLAMAKILDLDLIPATIGVVHPQGIKYLYYYRKPENINSKN
ncbi:hypothetical protein [Natranaerofaba carboxydovora]|uniref:hypothetical protein n=1 Tax=Natranaerofaba carboxydovora TaxID=2742683 RepID=UPI001F1488DA|nr:hypothetical protein [Natranaerofaba carboxydovora]UMZ74717.1 hypothetical protein ACONDI_02317 [Natranaerofaba carboxydovora]